MLLFGKAWTPGEVDKCNTCVCVLLVFLTYLISSGPGPPPSSAGSWVFWVTFSVLSSSTFSCFDLECDNECTFAHRQVFGQEVVLCVGVLVLKEHQTPGMAPPLAICFLISSGASINDQLFLCELTSTMKPILGESFRQWLKEFLILIFPPLVANQNEVALHADILTALFTLSLYECSAVPWVERPFLLQSGRSAPSIQ